MPVRSASARLIAFARKHHSVIVVTSAVVVFGTYFVREYFKDGWHDSVTTLQRAQSQNDVFQAIHDASPVHLPPADERLDLGYSFKVDRTPGSNIDNVTVNTDAMKHHIDEAYFDYQLTQKLLSSLEEVASVPPHSHKQNGEDWAALRLMGDEVGPEGPRGERKSIEELQALSSGLKKWIQQGNDNLDSLIKRNSALPADERAPSGFASNTLYKCDHALPVLPGKDAFQIHLASHVLLMDTCTTVEWWIDQEQSKERSASLALSIIFFLGWVASSIGKLTGEDDEEGSE